MMGFGSVGFRGNLLYAVIAAGALQAHAVQLTGTVKDAVTKAPIQDAMVSLLSSPELLNAMTDANGAFSIEVEDLTAIRSSKAAQAVIGFHGAEVSFTTGRAGAHVRATLHDLRGGRIAVLKDATLPEGSYALNAAPSSLPAGLYLVRVQVGNRIRSFKMSTLAGARSAGSVSGALRMTSAGSSAKASRLSKAAAGGVDWIVVSKDGYLKKNVEVMALTDAQDVMLDPSKTATAKLRIFSDDLTMEQIDWDNAAIYSWETTAVLATDSSGAGFGNSVASMTVSTMEGALWNGWAFHVAKLPNGSQPTADLTPYADGSLHLAVKGNAKSIGVMVSSVNQFAGTAPLVDLAGKGYLPDDAWHEIVIPMSEFAGTLDLGSVFVYAGFVSPAVQFGEFDPAGTYVVDDVYYLPKQ
jgi:hypothetical protein